MADLGGEFQDVLEKDEWIRVRVFQTVFCITLLPPPTAIVFRSHFLLIFFNQNLIYYYYYYYYYNFKLENDNLL